MSDKVKSFLESLATDPQTLKNYADDPDVTLAGAGLSAEESAAIKSGDRARIMGLVGPVSPAGIELVVEINVKIRL